MNDFIGTIKAEVIKQHKCLHHSKFVYFTSLLWPILIFINAFYMYKPFDLSNMSVEYGVNNEKGIITFLTTGYMTYNVFWAMVQSAWQMSDERRDGTLETTFLTSANRLSIVYGRALGALLESTWMFSIFAIIIIIANNNISVTTIIGLIVIFLLVLTAATIWGGFLNSIFLFSRDASFLFDIFDDPMCLFSGVRIPVESFPFWGKFIASIFPLTYTLKAVREIVNGNFIYGEINILKLVASLIIMIIITAIIINKAENNARKNGSLIFY